MIASIEPDSAAALAGLKTGDILLGLDGTIIAGADDLVRTLTGETIGREVETRRAARHRAADAGDGAAGAETRSQSGPRTKSARPDSLIDFAQFHGWRIRSRPH